MGGGWGGDVHGWSYSTFQDGTLFERNRAIGR